MTIIPFPAEGRGCRGNRNDVRPDCLRLPVAPRHFAGSRRAGDGAPGRVLSVPEGFDRLQEHLRQSDSIRQVMVDGPGDPLATPETTREMVETIHAAYPRLDVTITTLGIGLDRWAGELAGRGAKGITLLVDAVEPRIIEKLFLWIRPGKKNLPLAEAAAILHHEQAGAFAACRAAGLEVTIRTTLYPGVNDGQVEQIARTMAALGARQMILLPFRSPAGDATSPPAGDCDLLAKCRLLAGQHLAMVEPCETPGPLLSGAGYDAAKGRQLPTPAAARPNVAVVSASGMEVDLHLGQAGRILVYGPREDGLACLLATRPAPEPGGGGRRWEELAGRLSDCFALLAAGAGESPKTILAARGITVLVTEGDITGLVDALYGGRFTTEDTESTESTVTSQ